MRNDIRRYISFSLNNEGIHSPTIHVEKNCRDIEHYEEVVEVQPEQRISDAVDEQLNSDGDTHELFGLTANRTRYECSTCKRRKRI